MNGGEKGVRKKVEKRNIKKRCSSEVCVTLHNV